MLGLWLKGAFCVNVPWHHKRMKQKYLLFLFVVCVAFPSVIPLGCWIVSGGAPTPSPASTPGGCAQACDTAGYAYGALSGTTCTCTNNYTMGGRSNRCGTPCYNGSAIFQGYLCGQTGSTSTSVYALRPGKE